MYRFPHTWAQGGIPFLDLEVFFNFVRQTQIDTNSYCVNLYDTNSYQNMIRIRIVWICIIRIRIKSWYEFVLCEFVWYKFVSNRDTNSYHLMIRIRINLPDVWWPDHYGLDVAAVTLQHCQALGFPHALPPSHFPILRHIAIRFRSLIWICITNTNSYH